MPQSTVKKSAGLDGIGLHTGARCELVLRPAPEGSGIVFRTPAGDIEAAAENVEATNRGTSLRCGEAEVRTVEHLLAALAGMGIDNVLVEMSGPEIPAADGSALPFVELIEKAGVQPQAGEPEMLSMDQPVWAGDGGRWVLAVPECGYRVTALISYAHPLIGEQSASFSISAETFRREIAPARTFCTEDEIEGILSQGLGKGGAADNVIVARGDGYSLPLRFPNELVRHKLLDLIGDLSLAGGRLRAHVVAIKSGHALHAALAGKIRGCQRRYRRGG